MEPDNFSYLMHRAEQEGYLNLVAVGAELDHVTYGLDQHHLDNYILPALQHGMSVTISQPWKVENSRRPWRRKPPVKPREWWEEPDSLSKTGGVK